MNKQIGVWMDNKEATIITLGGLNAQIGYVKCTNEVAAKGYQADKGRSTDAPLSADQKTSVTITEKTHASSYQKEIFEMIKGANEWYVCGPDEAKTEFKQFITDNHSVDLSKLKGVESSKHLSNDELTDKVQNYFKAK